MKVGPRLRIDSNRYFARPRARSLRLASTAQQHRTPMSALLQLPFDKQRHTTCMWQCLITCDHSSVLSHTAQAGLLLGTGLAPCQLLARLTATNQSVTECADRHIGKRPTCEASRVAPFLVQQPQPRPEHPEKQPCVYVALCDVVTVLGPLEVNISGEIILLHTPQHSTA